MAERKDFRFWFWVHVAVILFIYSTPFIIDWRLFLVLAVIFYLQLKIFGNCILTQLEFGSGEGAETGFYYHYLAKYGLVSDRKKVNFTVVTVIPILVFFVSLVWQILLDYKPWFSWS